MTTNWTEEEVKKFAQHVLKEEGLDDWKVTHLAGGVGNCAKHGKEIMLGDNATFGIVLHEVAHALDKNPPTKDGHWGYHADLMHGLFDKYCVHAREARLRKEVLEEVESLRDTIKIAKELLVSLTTKH